MNTSTNHFDALESLLYEEALRIEAIDFHQGLDLFLVVLNTKGILRQRLSDYSSLKNATKEQLNNYTFIGGGTGVHWPELNEDLRLKSFLREELKSLVNDNKKGAA